MNYEVERETWQLRLAEVTKNVHFSQQIGSAGSEIEKDMCHIIAINYSVINKFGLRVLFIFQFKWVAEASWYDLWINGNWEWVNENKSEILFNQMKKSWIYELN